VDDFDWHGGAITRATPATPELAQDAEPPPLSARRVRRRLQVRPTIQGRHAKDDGLRSQTNGADVRGDAR
jgi:hypothetical protein